MAEKEIDILKEQIQKLDAKGFDLEAWKINSINILDRIFGQGSIKIEQLKELRYDFSSWNLRDTSGSAGSIKKKAKVILDSAINELELFGLPASHIAEEVKVEPVLSFFEDELKGAQFKMLKEILKKSDLEERRKELIDFIGKMEKELKNKLILNVLLKSDYKNLE